MAHFAQLDDNNVVLQVIVVSNQEILDKEGNESEAKGIVFCNELLGGRWVQTSYNGTIRKNFAGIGYTYDEQLDAFVAQQPYPSWVLDEHCKWQAPVAYPADGAIYVWVEDDLNWQAITFN